MAKKPDGVIVAVHFAPDGKIETIRLFERRGASYSDRVHVSRDQLVERIKNKKRYVTGKREKYLGGTFETGTDVLLLENGVIATCADTANDTLEGVPVF